MYKYQTDEIPFLGLKLHFGNKNSRPVGHLVVYIHIYDITFIDAYVCRVFHTHIIQLFNLYLLTTMSWNIFGSFNDPFDDSGVHRVHLSGLRHGVVPVRAGLGRSRHQVVRAVLQAARRRQALPLVLSGRY
jgi:hypothetical protein